MATVDLLRADVRTLDQKFEAWKTRFEERLSQETAAREAANEALAASITASADLDDLDDRVTILETAPVGEGPSIQAQMQTAINNAIAEADPTTIEIAPGTYTLTRAGTDPVYSTPYCFFVNGGARLRVRGRGGGRVVFRIPSSTTLGAGNYACGFYVKNASKIAFENVHFEATAVDNDLSTNTYPAIYITGTTQEMWVRGSTFNGITPATVISDDAQARFWFTENQVQNAPNSLVVSNDAVITGNHFLNDTRLTTRSHAIYLFGGIEKSIISNNAFKNIDKHALKWKGNSTRYERKQQLIVSQNIFDNCESAGEIGSDTEVAHGHVVYTGNTIRNCKLGFYGFAVQDAIVAQNDIYWDWQNPWTACRGITVQSTTVGSPGAIAMSARCLIANNNICHNAHFVGVLTFSSAPLAGDTVTVGATTYTWVAGAPATATEVQLNATVSTCASRLASAIRGVVTTGVHANATKNAALDTPNDVQIDKSNQTPQIVVINAPKTFALSTTGSALTVSQAVTDYRAKTTGGIIVANVLGACEVSGNLVKDNDLSISIVQSIEPRVVNNRILGWTNGSGSSPYAVYTIGNLKSIFTGNVFTLTPASDDTAGRRLEVNDAFPVVYDNYGVFSHANTKMKADLLGKGGVITCGDGKQRTLLFFGEDGVGGASPYSVVQSEPLTKRDGDTVTLTDGITPVTFTFKRTAPGANEFNTKASLITLINNNTGGLWTATNYDNLDYGYIEIKRVATGAQANDRVTVVTKAKNQLVQLDDKFYGGSAAADRTFVFTPLAAPFRALQMHGANANGSALTGVYWDESTDVVQGVGYLVRHSAAAAGAKLGFFVG